MQDKQLTRIENKIDAIDSRLNGIDVLLAKYNSELEFHIARTTQVEEELLPISSHVQQVRGALKLATWLIGTLVAVAAIYWSIKA